MIERGKSKSLSHLQGAPRGLLLHYMLHRIATKPCHGYEILQDIESKTEGAWRPGAGSIYPILKKLMANGYITADKNPEEDSRRVYSVTDKGREALEEDEKMFLNSGQRWMAMRNLFIELIRPEYLSKFFVEGTKTQFELAQEILKSKSKDIQRADLEYLLKEYSLNLERQLDWAKKTLEQLEPSAQVRKRMK